MKAYYSLKSDRKMGILLPVCIRNIKVGCYYTISKLMSRVISKIIFTRAFGTRVIIFDITLLFVC